MVLVTGLSYLDLHTKHRPAPGRFKLSSGVCSRSPTRYTTFTPWICSCCRRGPPPASGLPEHCADRSPAFYRSSLMASMTLSSCVIRSVR
ncbi:hypothetical protein KCP75_09365 [Salmonella enterica subsp. enterica]|nr:hypothetical protein KCP75_09365 [Salmonella enterica subsp. enterica]